MDIPGCAAIVTGGASGLGAATAAMLVRGGAKVAIFDLNEEVGTTTADRLGGVFHRTTYRTSPASSKAWPRRLRLMARRAS